MDSPMEVICSKYNGDTLCEILIRLDPSSIFNCMIVSKQWLSAITEPVFRRKYLNRWRNSNSKVVGMLLYDHIGMKSRRRPGLQLLPTSNLGVKLNATKPMLGGGIAFFISKSPKGGLLLFRGIDPKRFFVCKPISGGPPVELPPPPAHYKSCMANILSDDDDGEVFKVVLAWNCDDTRVRIQTYCSRSGKWGEQSSLTCCTPFRASPSSASMAKGSVVYWAALVNNKVRCLAAWNMDEGSRRISLIPEPVRKNNGGFSVSYGVSPQPQYSLLAATCSFHMCGTIHIWALDDDDNKDWHLLYSVRHASIWNSHYSSLLKPLFEEMPEHGFTFVSFVPGKSDSSFLEMDGHLFVYYFHTSRLELVEYWKHAFMFISLFVANYARLMHSHPLTLLDLGIWPSPPPALRLPPSS